VPIALTFPKWGIVLPGRAIHKLPADDPIVWDAVDLAVLIEPMLILPRTLREQIVILHRRLLAIVWDDEVCRRLMTRPGVGTVVELTSGCASRWRTTQQLIRNPSALVDHVHG
jgi:transposase